MCLESCSPAGKPEHLSGCECHSFPRPAEQTPTVLQHVLQPGAVEHHCCLHPHGGRPSTQKPALVLGALTVAESVRLVRVCFVSSSRLLTKINVACCITFPCLSSNASGLRSRFLPGTWEGIQTGSWTLSSRTLPPVLAFAFTFLCCVYVYVFILAFRNLHVSSGP